MCKNTKWHNQNKTKSEKSREKENKKNEKCREKFAILIVWYLANESNGGGAIATAASNASTFTAHKLTARVHRTREGPFTRWVGEK
jgi:hypothetical protein